MKPTITRLAVLVLAFVWLSGCKPSPPSGRQSKTQVPRHILLITVDTLRADHLSAYGYPRATSLRLSDASQEGILFEQAISQWPKTGPSFASMFTGQYPQSTGLTHKAAIHIPDEYLTLPELLQQAGFATVAVMSNGVLSRDLGWDRGFDEYLQSWDLAPQVSDDPVEYRKTMNARRVNELALPLLDRMRGAERLFAWIHYSDPHAPYLLPAGVENPFLGDGFDVAPERPPRKEARNALPGELRPLADYIAQYDANIAFADRQIGLLLDHARELGLLDDALVIFTADHGESLGEHGYYFGHGRQPYNPTARVPLLFWLPGQQTGPRRVTRPVELVDLYPTVVELALPGQTVPGLEGHSLAPFLRDANDNKPAEPAPHYAFSEAGGGSPLTHFRSVQSSDWKLIYHPRLQHKGKEVAQRWELYDLNADPAEEHNVIDQRPAALRELRSQLDGWMKGSEWIRRNQGQIAEHSEEVRKALKALGYTN